MLFQRLVDTWLPILVLVLLALSLSMDAYDTGLDIPGQRLSIDLIDSEAHKLWSRLDLPAIEVPIEPLHIHIALEASPRRKKNDTGDDDLPQSGTDGASNGTQWENNPTVIFFPPLDAPSGYSASHWLSGVGAQSHEVAVYVERWASVTSLPLGLFWHRGSRSEE